MKREDWDRIIRSNTIHMPYVRHLKKDGKQYIALLYAGSGMADMVNETKFDMTSMFVYTNLDNVPGEVVDGEIFPGKNVRDHLGEADKILATNGYTQDDDGHENYVKYRSLVRR